MEVTVADGASSWKTNGGYLYCGPQCYIFLVSLLAHTRPAAFHFKRFNLNKFVLRIKSENFLSQNDFFFTHEIAVNFISLHDVQNTFSQVLSPG